jgi:hypothetical protein
MVGARARRLPDYHQQRQAGSGKGAARCWLVLAVVVVSRWSMNLDVIFIMFGVLCTSCELMK